MRGSVVAVGDTPNTCEAKQVRVGPADYPYGQRSIWTEDAQRYANKLLAKNEKLPIEVTGVLDGRSCLTFATLCDEQWKAMGPLTLRPDFLVDRTTCDQIPCSLATCSHVDGGLGKLTLGLLLLGGVIAVGVYSQRGRRR